MFPELQLQNLDQTLCSKSEQKFSFMTKPQLLNLQQTVANMILIININNSNNINEFWVGIFTLKGHKNQVYLTGVSDGVSQIVSDKRCQWSDSGPTEIIMINSTRTQDPKTRNPQSILGLRILNPRTKDP